MASSEAQPTQVTSDSPECGALSLADGQKCEAKAISADGQFCGFHAKQCFGLYKGYKRRNAQLDALTASPPSYLAESQKKLINQNFSDVDDDNIADEIHRYLFKKYALLEKAIRARKLHHKHFYMLTRDYGHEKYLNSLITEKKVVTGALQRCYQRMAHLTFQKQKWFTWAKECQKEEEQNRENEQKKIKREAALFRRRATELDRLVRERRVKEDIRKQEEFLQQTYEKSMAERGEGDIDDDGDEWDPIGDVLDDERATYIALIKYCLWIDDSEVDDAAPELSSQGDANYDNARPQGIDQSCISSKQAKAGKFGSKLQSQDLVEDLTSPTTPLGGESSKLRARPVIVPTAHGIARPHKKPNLPQIENRSEMQQRLTEGTKIEGGKLESQAPNGTRIVSDHMPAIPTAEAARLVDEIAEIKYFLLCRLLLKDAVLLPAAQKASSLSDFFNDPQVKTQDLRDLSLKIEEPQLQDIRDSCADFFRLDDEESDDGGEESSVESEDEIEEERFKQDHRIKHPLPEIWLSKKEKQLRRTGPENAASRMAMAESLKHQLGEEPGARIQFGQDDDHNESKQANLRLKIFGRTIYNYPKKGSMSRRGWFHFSLIAKDCSVWTSIELCKSWDEFLELSILSLRLYFPSPQWAEWEGDMVRSQFLQFGFIPYQYCDDADKLQIRRDMNSRGHRGRIDYQLRNYVCAHMKRNDPISRRFIQHVSMQTSRMFILVRDGTTGQIIASPDEEELWLTRLIIGRSPRDESIQTTKYVGEEFFEEMDAARNFHVGFADFYDVYIWNADAGGSGEFLHASISELLHKAHQVKTPLDRWAVEAPVLKTLTVDSGSHRVRDIRKDEAVESIWDSMSSDEATFVWRNTDGHELHEMPKFLMYNEADALEDAILFPNDANTAFNSEPYQSVDNAVSAFESGRAQDEIIFKFAFDLDTDEEPSEELKKQVQKHNSKGRNKKSGVAKTSKEENPCASDDGASSWEEVSESDQDSGAETDLPDSAAARPVIGTGAHAPAIRSRNQSPSDYTSTRADILEAAERILTSFGKGPGVGRHMDLDAEFTIHIDLWRSKIFKETWHRCDYQRGAQEQWQEYLSIRSDAELDRNLLFELALPCAQLLKALRYHPETHLRVMKDARRAYSIITLFGSGHHSFFRTKKGSKHKNSQLFNQLERSKNLPDRRGFQSCRFREKSFYADFEKVQTESEEIESLYDPLPLEWDICIRPKIARFFREGLISVSNVPPGYEAGRAFAAREGERPLDLFFDFRETIPDMTIPKFMINPYTITIKSLRQAARDFSARSPKARFALLRLWSAAHFYPFMMGMNNRDLSIFKDGIGRMWTWKFMCKDMASSEYSVHQNMTARLEPLQHQLGSNSHKIKVRKDVVLVMGTDEEDLLKLAAAATFTVQTQPWRMEIDFWKSFVNVDVEFLDGLQDDWWA